MEEINIGLLRDKLPGQVFLSLHKILNPHIYFEENDSIKLRDEHFLFEFLDHNLSIIFNFVNDLIYGDIESKDVIRNRIEKGKPFLLYLRDFSLTSEFIKQNESKELSFYSISNTITGLDIPSFLSELNSESNFIIGIRNLKGITSKNVPMLTGELPTLLLHDQNWQGIANELISNANGIILHLSTLGMGSSFEIDCIRKHKRQDDCLLIYEPEIYSNAQQKILTEIIKVQNFYDAEDNSENHLKIINELFNEFENNMVYSSDSEWAGKIEIHKRIWKILNERVDMGTQKLQKIIENQLSLYEIIGPEAVTLLDRIIERNQIHLFKKGFDSNTIQALYIDASSLYLCGRFSECISKFLMIAYYAIQLLSKNIELSIMVNSLNLDRASASIFWATEDLSPNEAKNKATELYKILENKFIN